MSIGFITSGTTSRTVDIYSGGGNRSVDLSLQNVLNRYDKVKTDLDRLVDQAQLGIYDITSKQHYNSYNKESNNGWAENWYAEYRAVLALRADALQKKLQASYNRVLERSAYAEMNPDRESVFAPYANRTFKDDVNNTSILNNKMRIANVMMVDTEIVDAVTAPTVPLNYTQIWTNADILTYLNNVDGTGFPPGREVYTTYLKTGPDGRDINTFYHSYSEITNASPTYSGTPGGDMPDYRWPSGIVPDFVNNPWPTADDPGKDATTIATRNAQRMDVYNGITDALKMVSQGGTWPDPPPPLPPVPPPTQQELDERAAEISAYWANRDAAIEAGLQTADLTWKGSVEKGPGDSDDDSGQDSDNIRDDYRDFLDPADDNNFYKPVFDTVKGFNPNQTTTAPPPPTPGGGTAIPPDPTNYPLAERLMEAYNLGAASFSKNKYQGLHGEDFRVKVPEFGMGELYNLISNQLPPDIRDTIDSTTLDGLTPAINQIVQSFVGMQYNNIYKGNYYDSQPNASSIGIYGYVATNGAPFAAMQYADELYPGGSIMQAGATSIVPHIPDENPDSQVVIPLTPLPLSIDIGFKGTVGPDLYYGHQSAISNLSSTPATSILQPTALPTIGLGSASVAIGIGDISGTVQAGIIINVGFSYDIFAKAFEEILKRLKAFLVEAMTVNSYASSSGVAMDSYAARAEYHFTQPGFLEAVKALNFDIPVLGIPIPFPLGNMMETYMTTGLPSPFGTLTDLLGMGYLNPTKNPEVETQINGQRVFERLFNYKHGVQGAESRETETGAFFATNAFLGQFEMSDMESEYWIGTQQNEEIVNMDLARAFTTAGPEIIKSLLSSVAGVASLGKGSSTFFDGALEAVLSGQQDKQLANIMYDLMYRDQKGDGGSDPLDPSNRGNAVGQLSAFDFASVGSSPSYPNPDTDNFQSTWSPYSGSTTIGKRISMRRSSFTSEAYDYIENDHKPYEGDSDFNYKSGGILSGLPLIGGLMQDLFEANTPDFILEGIANTRRFTATQWDDNITIQTVKNAFDNQDASIGLGPRGEIGRGYGDYTQKPNDLSDPRGGGLTGRGLGISPYPDGNTDKGWADTDFNLGDINEVYTATRRVKFNDLTFGFGEFDSDDLVEDKIEENDPTGDINSDLGATRQTAANVKRYVGSDSRITERRYDGASAVNHETFTAGTYSGQYYADNPALGLQSKKYYDRRNSYSLSFTTKADGNQYNLFGSQALNPTMGGFLKMSTIDKNKTDNALLAHEKGGIGLVKSELAAMNATQRKEAQNFGGTVDGDLNELNELLYNHLHLRKDGRNLSLIKEYRDVFETGLMSSIFLSGQTYHQSGGGITSSIEIRYDTTQGKSTLQTDTRETYDQGTVNFDPYNTPFLTRSRGQATTYLNSYFAYKKRATNNKT